MRGFFKSVFATVTGIFIALFVVVLFFSVILINGSKSKSYNLQDDSILSLHLSGILKDQVQSNPVLEMLGLSDADEIALADILSSIKKAKDNDKIKGIYIFSEYLSASNASLLEIRNELENFKKSGKFIVAYADTYLQGCYFLSSVADKVILNPIGNLDLHGIASSRTFYKGLFEKIGVEVQVFKVGTYKSAVEPYILDKMSTANREQVSSYVNDIWGTVLNNISESRNIPITELNTIADQLPLLRDTKLVLEKGLVDTLMYETDVKQHLAELVGKESVDDVDFVTVENMTSVSSAVKEKEDKIAVLYAEGSIMSGKAETEINDRFYVEQLRKIKNDENVKAVVFRVNSPGGSAYASEQIWRAVTELKAVKPVVVSMGDYAASGGYYISCSASKIIAQPSTLTGSIGIFGMFPNVEGLTKKIGLTFDNVKTNKFSDFGDFTRPMRDDEKIILQEYINEGYDKFLTRCAEGRGIPKDSLAKIAEGRVWTGNQALKIGLVDALGGIDKAVDEAAKLAGTDSYSLEEYPVRKGFWENLFSDYTESIAVKMLKDYFGSDYELIKTAKEIKEMKEQDFIQARLPFNFELK